jgi:hypothetical protein
VDENVKDQTVAEVADALGDGYPPAFARAVAGVLAIMGECEGAAVSFSQAVAEAMRLHDEEGWPTGGVTPFAFGDASRGGIRQWSSDVQTARHYARGKPALATVSDAELGEALRQHVEPHLFDAIDIAFDAAIGRALGLARVARGASA